MQITIDLDEGLAREIVRWKRMMDRAGEKLTGLNVYEGMDDRMVVERSVQGLMREGMDWEKDRYGLIVVHTGADGAVEEER